MNLTKGFDSSVIVTSSKQIVSMFPIHVGVSLDGLIMLNSKPVADGGLIQWNLPQPVKITGQPDKLSYVTVGPGGGGGVQLQHGAHRGRLLFCGTGHRANDTAHGQIQEQRTGWVGRWRDCHFDDNPLYPLLKHPLKVEGGAVK